MKELGKCDASRRLEEGKARRKEKCREMVLRGKKMIGRKAIWKRETINGFVQEKRREDKGYNCILVRHVTGMVRIT